MNELDVEWILLIYSLSIQPLIVRYIAKNYKKDWEKIREVILLSLLAGAIGYYFEYGRLENASDVMTIVKMVAKIAFFSFGAWTTIWKKILPYKNDPLEDVNIQKEYRKTVEKEKESGTI